MKKTLFVTCALLALTAGMASAQGHINLAWQECAGEAGSSAALSPACTSNAGSNILYGSFAAPVEMPHFNGHAAVLDLQTNQAALSPWWFMGATGCRAGLASGDYNFTAAAQVVCTDPWGGHASGGLDYADGFGGPNRARIRTVCAVADAFQFDVLPATEYYCFKVAIANTKTAGTGCPGCLDQACIVLNSILITQPAGDGDYTLTTGPQQFVTWRGGAIGGLGCPAATPTHKGTWGSVKALYR
jgi:hypothetical protein